MGNFIGWLGALLLIFLAGFGLTQWWHWSVNEGWVLKCTFHANKKDANTSITF
ncbi:MAG: hypothetical protein ACK5BG_09465 [Pseudanabaena sp.]|jgi:hypothetical protein